MFTMQLLGACESLRKATVSIVMSIRWSLRFEQFDSNWTDFHELLYLSNLKNLSTKFNLIKI